MFGRVLKEIFYVRKQITDTRIIKKEHIQNKIEIITVFSKLAAAHGFFEISTFVRRSCVRSHCVGFVPE